MFALALPLVRHGLQFGLGVLAGKGFIDAQDVTTALTQWDVVVPAFGAVVTFGWFVVDFVKKVAAAKAAA
jgi:hypothetical protein